MRPILAAAVLVAVTVLSGCTGNTGTAPWTQPACTLPGALPAAEANPQVVFQTSLGNITAEIYREQVPATAKNFLDLARSGFYDGTRFHRIITDFMMQGGDPATKDSGSKAEAPAIPDEFHWQLRHDKKGVLSMANAGPNTGSSQFFITFNQTSWLDDKHAVFGQVVQGFDVLDRVNAQAASASGTPKTPVTLAHVQVLDGAPRGASALGISLSSPDASHAVQKAGGETQFLVVAQNDGDRDVPVCVQFPGLSGLQARSEAGFANFDLPAGQRVAFVVQARADGASPPTAALPVELRTVGAQADLNLTVAKDPQVTDHLVAKGEKVTANYIGMTVDGRLFDTSIQAVAKYASDHHLGYGGFQVRKAYSTFDFTPGSGVIDGFTDLAVGTHVGGKSAARIPPEKAYGTSCVQGQQCSPLAGRTLLFQLEIVALKQG